MAAPTLQRQVRVNQHLMLGLVAFLALVLALSVPAINIETSGSLDFFGRANPMFFVQNGAMSEWLVHLVDAMPDQPT